MKKQKTLRFITRALLLSATVVSSVVPFASAQTNDFASGVVDYTAGTGISATYTHASSALGEPGGSPGGSGTLNPFVPNYTGSELTGIGVGGQLTISLANFVTVGPAGTQEIGIFGNSALVNTGASGAPAAANPATAFGVRSVLISVSADGVNFVPLNAGTLITSTLPVNYYTNPDTTNINAPPPANPSLADFGKPFIGSLTDFNGQTYAQTLTTLNGSAGGTWLDLSATGLSQVGYIRFDEPSSGGANGGVFYLNGVSGNENLIGGIVVPEPGTTAMLIVLGGALAVAWGRRRRQVRYSAAILAVVGAGVFGLTGNASAQMLGFSSIQNWTGSGSNEAALVIDWHDGKTPESLVWGYRFNGMSTGLQMIQAIDAADPRLAVFYAYGGGFIYGIGYDLNNNGGTFTPGTPGFDDNGNSTEIGSASDPNDHYAEGSFSKFWGYDLSAGSPYGGGGTWTESNLGAGSQPLINGDWNGYSLSYDETNFTIPDPGFPTPAAPVPEPSALLSVASALAVVIFVNGVRQWRFRPAQG